MQDFRKITPLDAFDIKLLTALQQDCSQTHQQLADQVHLSASQCSRRVQRLMESGLIAKTVALLKPEAVGLTITAYVMVTLRTHGHNDVDRLNRDLALYEEIVELASLTGEADYVIKLRCRDMKHLSDILNDRLMAHPEVATVKTSVVLQPLKETTEISLAHAQNVRSQGS
jgi:Lrp/AsnC family transcriptional regulator, leucine-responsive regulatory protein